MAAAGMSDWRAFSDRESLDQALAVYVVSRLQQGIAERGTAYLVVSGGSTPVHLFSILAGADVEWSRVVVLLADERWVPVDHKDSNERLVRETLLTGKAKPAQFFSLLPTPDDETTDIAGLSTLLGSLPRFDVVLLGMGEDAHTASLFPCASALREGLTTQQGALMMRPRNAPHRRVSLSKQRLQATEHGVIHIVGEKKKAVLELARKSGDEMCYPISGFLGPAGFVCWWAP
jgi:6-phosphogluconolactonase